jgi:hypothetical protein
MEQRVEHREHTERNIAAILPVGRHDIQRSATTCSPPSGVRLARIPRPYLSAQRYSTYRSPPAYGAKAATPISWGSPKMQSGTFTMVPLHGWVTWAAWKRL